MHTVIMGRKRVMVGAINIILILLLVQFMKQCSSSSSHDGNSSANDTEILRPNNTTEPTPRWPRRMLGGHESVPNNTTRHIPGHKHKATNMSSMDGNQPVSSLKPTNVPEESMDPADRLQAQECSPSSSAHCTNNGTGIDPRYGVEKRLVPTGPNPLHN
ncbi:hypothetical protein L7F22_034585 [Adiantum nelumboides]|nr:hypothetical protein [Adiantum nelumboides]